MILVLRCIICMMASLIVPLYSQDSHNIFGNSRDERFGKGHIHHKRCKMLQATHNVVVGESWGNLTNSGIEQWKIMLCDRVFCKRHALESKGSYKCDPLPPEEI